MVCMKCGKELPEGTKFCVSCGAPCEEAAAPQTAAPKAEAASEAAKEASDVQKAVEAVNNAAANDTEANGNQSQKPNSDNKKNLIFIAGGVAVLLLLIVFCNLIFGSSPKKAFKAYVKGQYSCDYKAIWNNSITAKKAQKALDLYDKDDYEDDYEDFKEYYEDLKEDWKDDDIKYKKLSIDIKKVEKIGKSKKEFEWAQELLEDYYDCDADKVKQFAIVEAKIKADYYEDGERDKSYDVNSKTEYLLVKIGGDWYMTGYSRDDIKKYLKDRYK